MKKIFYMTILSIAALLFGCNDSENNVLSDDYSNEKNTKGMVSPVLGTESESNPYLYDYWDDLSKVDTIFLNREGKVDPPWLIKPGNSMRIPENIRTDIKREDGWFMLGHTLERVGLAEPNYLLFYNKKTGILKGFYYSDAAEQNQNVKWVLSTSQPSSLLPPNERVSNLSNQGQIYAITSNTIIPSVVSSEGPLVQGWNCFTFELPYGTLNHNPIISITGYSINRYESTSTGTFSGQVVVPTMVNSNELDAWKSFLNMTSSFTGATNTFAGLFKPKTGETQKVITTNEKSTKGIIETIGIINSAVSIASNLLGGASFFTSKKELVIQRYDFSGDVKLTGEVIGEFDGIIKSSDNIDLGLLNNNKALGVWGLKELPKIEIDKYHFVRSFSVPIEDYDFYDVNSIILIKPEVPKESVIINPALLPSIKNYKVTVGDIISTNSATKKIQGLAYQEITDDWYSYDTDAGRLTVGTTVLPAGYQYMWGITNADFYMKFLDTFPEMYVSVLVEIEYNDGDFLSSSRVFKVNGTIKDNRNDIMKYNPSYTQPIFEDYRTVQ